MHFEETCLTWTELFATSPLHFICFVRYIAGTLTPELIESFAVL